MTVQKVLEIYNQAKGLGDMINEENLRGHKSACKAVNALVAVDEMINRLGGEARSRQIYSTIIFFAERDESL